MFTPITKICPGPSTFDDLILEYYVCPDDMEWDVFLGCLACKFPDKEQELVMKDGKRSVVYRSMRKKPPCKMTRDVLLSEGTKPKKKN
jgi:hypothetical protein